MRKLIFATVMLIAFACSGSIDAQYYPTRPVPRPNSHNRYNPGSDYSRYSLDVNYKGFLEAGFAGGVGTYKANQLDILTTHGVTFGDSFFFGVGTGANILFTRENNSLSYSSSSNYYNRNDFKTSAVMIPLYADFRINCGKGQVVPFIDCKLGAAFLVSDDYVSINNGWLDSNTSLYFSPSIGLHIRLNRHNAFNLGVTYNLISQKYYDYDYYTDRVVYHDGISLSSFGGRLSIEW